MELMRYDAAKRAVAEYKTVDDLVEFRNKAMALEGYAKIACDFALEHDCAVARVRAERRAGVLMSDMKRGKTGPKIITSDGLEVINEPSEYKKACDDAGISKDNASKWQQLAAVPEDEFEKAVSVNGSKPSTNHIIKKEEDKPRMDSDALWLRGTLRDMRKMKLFDKNMESVISEWTPAMKEDADSIIPKLIEWVNTYE